MRNNFEYEPNGSLSGFLYGSGLCRRFGYSSRMQLAESVAQGAPQGTTCFDAGEQPLVVAYSWVGSFTGKNNGNLWSTTTYQNGPSFPQALGFNEGYTYDNLNRLDGAAYRLDGAARWSRTRTMIRK